MCVSISVGGKRVRGNKGNGRQIILLKRKQEREYWVGNNYKNLLTNSIPEKGSETYQNYYLRPIVSSKLSFTLIPWH